MLRELKTFITVARLGTFAAAGQQVGLTQSAVSAQMRVLEQHLLHVHEIAVELRYHGLGTAFFRILREAFQIGEHHADMPFLSAKPLIDEHLDDDRIHHRVQRVLHPVFNGFDLLLGFLEAIRPVGHFVLEVPRVILEAGVRLHELALAVDQTIEELLRPLRFVQHPLVHESDHDAGQDPAPRNMAQAVSTS